LNFPKKSIAKRGIIRIKPEAISSLDEGILRRDRKWIFFRITFYVIAASARTSSVFIIFLFDFMGLISLMTLSMIN
jgi:hypothetical protein